MKNAIVLYHAPVIETNRVIQSKGKWLGMVYGTVRYDTMSPCGLLLCWRRSQLKSPALLM
jgi:hypothetical protein